MTSDESPARMTTDQIEGRFLTALEKPPFPIPELLEMLVVLHSCGQTQRRDDCLLVLQECLVEHGDRDGAVRLAELRAAWSGSTPGFATELREFLGRVMKSRWDSALVDSVGWGTVPSCESLRRLRVLLACRPGVACLDRTWGFGVIRELDDFYRRLLIDFDRRANHALTLPYAAEVLKILDSSHVLCVRHADPKAFEEQLRKHPDDVVRMVLRSLGPMPVTRLEEEFTAHRLLPDGMDWKRFWTSARTALKRDPLVRIPPATRKNESVELLTKAVVLGDATWFETLGRERDLAVLLRRMAEFQQARGDSPLEESARAVLKDRLQFAWRAAETSRNLPVMARTALLAVGFAMEPELTEAWIERVTQPEFLIGAAAKLPVRDVDQLVAMTPVETDEAKALFWIDALPGMPYTLIEALLPRLLRGAAREAAQAAVRTAFLGADAPPALVLWVARHVSNPEVEPLIAATSVATQCLAALDAQESGERLRIQHQIARRFEDFSWVEKLAARMGAMERSALNERIHATEDAWEPATKRSILGHLIKLYPELAKRRATTTRAERDAEQVTRWTSWRTYQQRQEQRRKLIEEDLPANSRDIAVARSYGDLRENFEYQSAKDTQRMLLQRQADMDAEIKAVTPTDFAGLPTDLVGVGTTVVLQRDDGIRQTLHVLGEWDSDEALGIVPKGSRVAEVLLGRAPGDRVDFPTEDGSIGATIESVDGLDEPIRRWVMVQPGQSPA